MTDVTLRDWTVPTGPDEPGWHDLLALTDLHNRTWFELEGNAGLTRSPEQMRLALVSDRDQERTVQVADAGGEVVGYAWHRRARDRSAHLSFTFVAVAPEWRGRGLGTGLLGRVLEEARSAGSATLQSFAVHPGDGSGTLVPVREGVGGVPGDGPGARFAVSHGFALVQASIGSILHLPVSGERLDHLDSGPADDYEIRTWEAPSPDDLLDDLGVLRAGLWADAPSGGQATSEERYDAERLRSIEAAALAGGGRRLYAGAVHRPSGRLVGFTEIDVPTDEEAPASQEYTVVRREHRGHGLGLRVKVANIRALAAASPGTRSVTTYNAAENGHVLRVNTALGFRAYAASGAWRLDL